MFFEKFFKEYDLKTVFPIYYISGEDQFLKQKCVNVIIDQIKKQRPKCEFYKFSDKGVNLGHVMDLCQSISFGCDFKCVIIKDFEWDKLGKKEQEILLDVFSNLEGYCSLIIFNLNISINKTKIKKLLDVIKNIGKFIEIKKPNVIQTSDFIVSEVENQALKISSKNAKKLAEFCDCDFNHIFQEINKLLLYCDGQAEILEKDIELLVVPRLETKVFDIIKLINNKDRLGALKMLNDLLISKMEPTMILSVIAMNFLDIYRAKVAKQGGASVQELVDLFGYKGKEFRVNKAFAQSDKYDMEKIKDVVDLLIKSDYQLKTTQIDKKLILETLIIKIINWV